MSAVEAKKSWHSYYVPGQSGLVWAMLTEKELLERNHQSGYAPNYVREIIEQHKGTPGDGNTAAQINRRWLGERE
jgi:hypothetical protein